MGDRTGRKESMKSIEERVDNLISPQKNRRRRGIGRSKKMTVGIFAVLIAVTLIASGALLSYYGSIETTVTVEQSIRLDGMTYSSGYADITITNDIGSLVAGNCVWSSNCHNLHLHSGATDPVSTKVSSVVSPSDGGLTTTIAAEVQDAGAMDTGATMTAYVYDSVCDVTVTTASELTTALGGTDLVIYLEDGTYTGTFSIGRAVTLKGESEAGVIIDGNGAGNVFSIAASGNTVTIQGMTIQDGVYGIRSTAGDVNVKHCTFVHNGWDGTGITTPTQSEMATLWASSATSNGGAIRIQDSTSSEVAYVTAYENARGIRIQDTDSGNIHDCISHDNLESGIYLSSSDDTSAHGCTNTVVENCDSYNNMNNGLLSIGGKNNDFHGNNVYNNWNSGMALWHVGDNDIYNNNFYNNNLYAFNGVGAVSGDAY